MKDLKQILNNHKEYPDSSVWDKISSELETVQPANSRVSNWKIVTVAAVVATISIVAIGIVSNKSKSTVNIAETHSELIDEVNQNSVHEEYIDEIIRDNTEQKIVEVDKRGNDFIENPKAVNPQPTAVVAASEIAETKELATSSVSIDKKNNVTQVVIPSNSTLARQLQSDPILKNMSGDEISLDPPVSLSIPNLFTPNGDGINDMFVVEGIENYSSTRLVVRDRAGRIVFQRANYQNDWDGGGCVEGAYSYDFFFTYNGIENCASGKIRILRD